MNSCGRRSAERASSSAQAACDGSDVPYEWYSARRRDTAHDSFDRSARAAARPCRRSSRRYGHAAVVEALRSAAGESARTPPAARIARLRRTPSPRRSRSAPACCWRPRFRPSLRRVINATGVIIHTNLGRAPLGDAAVRAHPRAGGRVHQPRVRRRRGPARARATRMRRPCSAASRAPRPRSWSTTAPPPRCWRSPRWRAAGRW